LILVLIFVSLVLGRHALLCGFSELDLYPPIFYVVIFPFFNNIYEHLTKD